MVNVQPPRREDLQPSYAQTLVGESDQGNHGWYGSMSMSQSSQVVRKEN
jgi:erythrocyte band 7 integral membrane protein